MLQGRSLRAVLVAAAMLAALAAGCSSSGDDGGQAGAASGSGSGGGGGVYKLTQQLDMSIEVSSTKFNETRRIPRTYSCERDDISPPIDWSGVPDGAVSLALLVDSDQLVREERPDLVWVHWMLWNIPPDASGVPENVPEDGGRAVDRAQRGTGHQRRAECRLVRAVQGGARNRVDRRQQPAPTAVTGRRAVLLPSVRAGHRAAA